MAKAHAKQKERNSWIVDNLKESFPEKSLTKEEMEKPSQVKAVINYVKAGALVELFENKPDGKSTGVKLQMPHTAPRHFLSSLDIPFIELVK